MTLTDLPPLARVLLAVLVATGLLLAPLPAQASSNSGEVGCLRGYNYADPQRDYLFAASEALADDCAWLEVDIANGGYLEPGAPFAYSYCQGGGLVTSTGWWYVSTSSTLGSTWWDGPCSNHIGAPDVQMIHYWGSLHFVY